MTETAEPRFINQNAFDVHVPDPKTGQMLTVRPFAMRDSRRYPESAIFVVTGRGFKKHVSRKGPLWPFPGEGVARPEVTTPVIERVPEAPPKKPLYEAPVRLAASLGSLEVPADIANDVADVLAKIGIEVTDMETQGLMAYVVLTATGEDASLPHDRFLGMKSYLDKIVDDYETVAEPEDEDEDDSDGRETFKKSTLLAEAKNLGITGTGRMNKNELIDAIRAASE